jgi:hypothetical protein
LQDVEPVSEITAQGEDNRPAGGMVRRSHGAEVIR